MYPLRVSSKPNSEPQDCLKVLPLTCKVSSLALPIIDIGSVPSIPTVFERELFQSPHIFTSNYRIKELIYPIPAGLFMQTANIYAFVYRLRRSSIVQLPPRLTDRR